MIIQYMESVVTQQMIYGHRISDIDRLKCVLIDCWTQLSQDTLNQRAISCQKTDDGLKSKECMLNLL